MRTISQVVEEEIRRSPFLQEAMAEGIANNAKIARHIRPAIEKRMLEKVSEASITMALHRLSKVEKASAFGSKFLKHVRNITVRSDLVEYVFPSSADLTLIWATLSRIAKKHPDAFVNFSRGRNESLVILGKELEEEVTLIAKKEGGVRRDALSAVTMHLPESSLNAPGLYYPVLKALAHEGLSFVEVMSVNTEFSIIFNDEDIDRAFSVIKRLTA